MKEPERFAGDTERILSGGYRAFMQIPVSHIEARVTADRQLCAVKAGQQIQPALVAIEALFQLFVTARDQPPPPPGQKFVGVGAASQPYETAVENTVLQDCRVAPEHSRVVCARYAAQMRREQC